MTPPLAMGPYFQANSTYKASGLPIHGHGDRAMYNLLFQRLTFFDPQSHLGPPLIVQPELRQILQYAVHFSAYGYLL